MHTWQITRTDSRAVLRAGAAPSVVQAWVQALRVTREVIPGDRADGEGYAITVEGRLVLIYPEYTPSGELDVPATAAAAEGLLASILAGHLLQC